jgi:hypothetical protein
MINIQEVSEIEAALEKALRYPKKIMYALEHFIAQTHPYSDGRSSARVIDACLHFLEHATVKPKPLNLIRRYQIRKKLNYWRVW